MGAINYRANKIINIGYKSPFNICDDYDDACDNAYCGDIFDVVTDIIDKLPQDYYKVTATGGYYDGFYIDIKRDCYFLNHYTERAEMLREWGEIQKALEKILRDTNTAVYTSCGWTGCAWLSYKDGLKALKQAGKAERDIIRHRYRLASSFQQGEMFTYINDFEM